MKHKGIIYARISKDHRFALGYLDWYRNQFRYQAALMFEKQYPPNLFLQIMNRLEKQDFHFAARVRKTHHVSIPVDPMLFKLKGFLREQADLVIDELNKPEQLEFNFGDNTNEKHS